MKTTSLGAVLPFLVFLSAVMTKIQFESLITRDAPEKTTLTARALSLPPLLLTERQLCDLELLLNGGFFPLTGFMNGKDYDRCCREMRLTDGTLWPLPVTLDISQSFSETNHIGDSIALFQEGEPERPLAILDIQDIYSADPLVEAQQVYNTTDATHPMVHVLVNEMHPLRVGGALHAINLPVRKDHNALRMTPDELRAEFASRGWTRIVAFQTRNPMHRAHRELTVRAAAALDAKILVHPVVGLTKPGDIDYRTRIRTYKIVLDMYPPETAMLSLLPLAMRMGGPREALLHAIVRRNYGCTHFIVGRDHAGPGSDSKGNLFYQPYEAQELALKYQDELGIEICPFQMVVYCPDTDEYLPQDQIEPGTRTLTISGTELRRRLVHNEPIPAWFSYPEVVAILREAQQLKPQ